MEYDCTGVEVGSLVVVRTFEGFALGTCTWVPGGAPRHGSHRRFRAITYGVRLEHGRSWSAPKCGIRLATPEDEANRAATLAECVRRGVTTPNV